MNKTKLPKGHAQRSPLTNENVSNSPQKPVDDSQIAVGVTPSIVSLQRYIGNSGMNALLAQGVTAGGGAIQRDWFDDATSAVSDTASGVAGAVSDAAGSAYDAASGAASSAYNAVSGAASSAYDAASGAVGAVTGAVSDALGIDGIIAQIEGVIRGIQREVESQIDGILSGIREEFSGLEELTTGDLSAIMELPPQIQEKAQTFIDKLMGGRGENVDELQALWDEWKPLTERLGEAMPQIDALKSRLEALETNLDPQIDSTNQLVEGFASNAESQIGTANVTLPDITPLKDMISRAVAALSVIPKALFAQVKAFIAGVKKFFLMWGKYCSLKNIGYPWFWLDLATMGIYRELARAAFKAGYSHYLPKAFIDNYVDLGGAYMMNEKDMGQCAVVADVTEAEGINFRQEALALFKTTTPAAPKAEKKMKFAALSVATTHGTLGSFHINFEGTLTANLFGDKDWEFNGTMNFHDLWDFDYSLLTLIGFGDGHRSFYGELLTASAAEFLPGTGFDINSANIPVTQSNKDREAEWSGKGIPGVPSRLARALPHEQKGEKGGETGGESNFEK
jgi:hypothetical protein